MYLFHPPIFKKNLFVSLSSSRCGKNLIHKNTTSTVDGVFLNKNISGYLVKEMSDILSILSFEFKVSYAHFSLE